MRVTRFLEPSSRAHGAQRILGATVLVVEAFVVFFAVLVAHQLVSDQRALTWSWGLLTSVALVACSGMLKRGAVPYYIGAVLQVPVILLGLQVPAMWAVGVIFAILYVYSVVKGHQLDGDKDAIDAAHWRAEATAEGSAAGPGPDASASGSGATEADRAERSRQSHHPPRA